MDSTNTFKNAEFGNLRTLEINNKPAEEGEEDGKKYYGKDKH